MTQANKEGSDKTAHPRSLPGAKPVPNFAHIIYGPIESFRQRAKDLASLKNCA